jgi:hypothetical protein
VFWIGPKTTRAASFMQGIEAFLHEADPDPADATAADSQGEGQFCAPAVGAAVTSAATAATPTVGAQISRDGSVVYRF